MRTRAALRFIVFAAAAAAVMVALVMEADGAPAVEGASVTTPGPFELSRADGSKLESLELDGAPYALLFGFTHCPDVCPTALAPRSPGNTCASTSPTATPSPCTPHKESLPTPPTPCWAKAPPARCSTSR